MEKWLIHKEVFIRTAHRLYDYPHECKNLHGEYYRVRIWISANKLDKYGMVIDFKWLKAQIMKYDHQYINEIKPFDKISPTVENISKVLFWELQRQLDLFENKPKLEKIRIYESDSSYCEYTGD